MDGVTEGVAKHQLCVALKELSCSFQLRQELLLAAVLQQLALRAQMPVCQASSAALLEDNEDNSFSLLEEV